MSNGRLGRLLKSYDKDPNELPKDKRGPKENQGIDNKVMETITQIVTSLPKYVSHYGRSKDAHDNI